MDAAEFKAMCGEESRSISVQVEIVTRAEQIQDSRAFAVSELSADADSRPDSGGRRLLHHIGPDAYRIPPHVSRFVVGVCPVVGGAETYLWDDPAVPSSGREVERQVDVKFCVEQRIARVLSGEAHTVVEAVFDGVTVVEVHFQLKHGSEAAVCQVEMS